MEQLLAYFQTEGFSQQDVSSIASKFCEKQLKKGDFFVEEGKTSKYLGFVESGFLQYYMLLNGEEKTTYAVGAGNFVASLVSFLKQTPSRENIRVLVNTTLWVIGYDELKQLQREVPAFNDFYNHILEWQICCIDESRMDAITLTAQERYEKMLTKEPALIQQIPLQNLASILGITPRHLSRIRNNIR